MEVKCSKCFSGKKKWANKRLPQEKNFQLIGLDGSSVSLALTKGMDFISAWADEETFYQYGSFNSVPTVFLIDKSGKIVAQIPADGRNQEQLSRRIAALLKKYQFRSLLTKSSTE